MTGAGWQPARRKPSIPLALLMGPLGAGKTTLLNRLLAEPAFADTAVIVNEPGAVALDGGAIAETGDGLIALGAGCVCCTTRGELVEALERLLRALDNGRIARIARVVIETAGEADPAPIFALLTRHPYLALRFHLDGIVTVLGRGVTLASEATIRQVASADRIVLADAGAVPDGLVARLRVLNPEAPLLDAAAGEARASALTGILEDVTHGLTTETPRAPDNADAFALARSAALTPGALEAFLDQAAARFGEALISVRGIVALTDFPERPALIRGYGPVLALPLLLAAWPDGDRRTRFVVHGRGLDRRAFETLFDAHAGALAVDTPDRAALVDNPLSIAGFPPR